MGRVLFGMLGYAETEIRAGGEPDRVRGLCECAVTGQARKYPVIVFSHGLGGQAMTYSTLASEFASRGFVVVCPVRKRGVGLA